MSCMSDPNGMSYLLKEKLAGFSTAPHRELSSAGGEQESGKWGENELIP